MPEYKYDVAFSFLKEDEVLAIQLNDLLQSRLSTFLYSKKQEEIAGTDGEETFNKVFGVDARIVVVLYRKGWGNTPWTRIEETAIKNRAYDEGYEFVIFIPLNQSPEVPKWLPKTRIWIGLERWGIEGAASVIESRVQETGGAVHEETLEDHAIQVKRQIEAEQARKRFLASTDGVQAANKEFNDLATQIESNVSELKNKVGFDIVCKHNLQGGHQWIEVYGPHFCVCAEWYLAFSNTLDHSRLDISLLKGHPRRPNRMILMEPILLQHLLLNFDIDPSQNHGWQMDDLKFMTTNQMAEFCLRLLIDHISKQELGNRASPKS